MSDPTVEALHRARTALRQAALDYAAFKRRKDRPGRRTYDQAGRDAIRHILAATADLYAARALIAQALDEDLHSTAAPADTGAATEPTKGRP